MTANNLPKEKKDELRRELARKVRTLSVNDFYQQLVDNNICHAYIIYENGEFNLSHPKVLEPLKAFFELSQDFAQHEGVFIGREEGLDTLFFAFVHDTRRGLAQGGLRFHRYNSLAELMVDGLRLSQGMTRKNALAGLWWGGGKGIMSLPLTVSTEEIKPGSEQRKKYFEGYGRFIASLGGIYYTAEDVGTNTADMQAILSQNRFTTCIPPTAGGSGNPSPFTARGVLRAMQAAWKVLEGTDNLQGVKVAVQGAGNVGAPLIRYLYQSGAKIWFCEMSEERARELKEEMPGLIQVPMEEIFDQDADIFAPCAIGAQVNQQTIPRLKVRLVCGAANNILKEPEADALRLQEKGIAFVPDFVANRMGIINCADEWHGYLGEDIRVEAEKVYPDTLRVFKYARNRSSTTMQAAKDLADIAASELHPMVLHRGRRLIDHLITAGWHKSGERSVSSPDAQELAFVPSLDEVEIRVGWERQGHFRGHEFTIAASPVSAASTPDLSSFLSPLLLDVRARSIELLTGKRPRRVMGSNHGGLSLQIAVEQQIPYERKEVGHPRFIELCQDLHRANDEEIRKQLHKLGIGFDQHTWLNPMNQNGVDTVNRLFRYLKDAELITRQKTLLNHCPSCQTIVVSSDVERREIQVETRYALKFRTEENETVKTMVYFPEYVLGAVALAVKPDGHYGTLAGKRVRNPVTGKMMPVIAVKETTAEAEFITPLHSLEDEKIALENGITEAPKIFDDNGNIGAAGYEGFSREEVRSIILERFGADREIIKGSFTAIIARCKRCETLVIPQHSVQLFARFDEAKELLHRAIEDNTVQFSDPNWKNAILSYLNTFDSWCISRQYWWGNQIPEKNIKENEVFSTWFSLTAMALQGAGWPENPKPHPVDEVFVDPDYLVRWVVPAQLISLLITGRPVFAKINVHGSLHVMERILREREDMPVNANDEERFIYNTVKRPMQKRLGNVVEPVTLIRRFGADSLRLAYLLCLKNGYHLEVTASQDRFNLARRSLHRLVSKLTNIINLMKKHPAEATANNDADLRLFELSEKTAEETRLAYHENRLADAARQLISMNEHFVDYCNDLAKFYHENQNYGNARETIPAVIRQMKEVFGPICPYIFEKLERWLAGQNILGKNTGAEPTAAGPLL